MIRPVWMRVPKKVVSSPADGIFLVRGKAKPVGSFHGP